MCSLGNSTRERTHEHTITLLRQRKLLHEQSRSPSLVVRKLETSVLEQVLLGQNGHFFLQPSPHDLMKAGLRNISLLHKKDEEEAKAHVGEGSLARSSRGLSLM